MSVNKTMLGLGSKRSVIREIFEYSKIRANEIGKNNVYDFSLGNPSVAPPKEIEETIKNLLNTANPTLLHGYTSAQGDLSVRKTIAESINTRFKLNLTENNIYMTCGAAASLSICLKALMNEGDECIVFAPFFTEYRVFIENAGGKVVISKPLEPSFQIDIEDFESKITPKTSAIIINSPNNPSGVVYSEETVKRVCEILRKKSLEYGKDIYIIADEPYRELVYGDVFVPYFMNYYENTVVCYSYSKALSLPGERIGYIAVNPQMKENVNVYLAICGAGRSLGYVCAPSLFQQVVKNCIDAKVDVNVYKENRDILLNNLTAYGYECVKPDGAFYLFVKALEEDAYAFCEKAKKHEILVVPCDDFGVKGYVRISYCVDKKRIENSLPAFKALAEEYGK
ncbi:MAG: pyridoxal phosphate-dependent aminotransferase [Clostridiales bacterium]|nr:pyridoxal phosphate-dependent aminotransferase [Clostridiales bacterium]